MKKIVILCVTSLILTSCQTGQARKNKIVILDNLQQGIIKLTDELKKTYKESVQKTVKKRMAVLIFVNNDGIKSELGRYISNSLQIKLFNPKLYSLLERERIDSLLSEHKFGQSGLVSNVDTKKLGELLGADLVTVGTITFATTKNNVSYFSINSRIVELESGVISAVSMVNIPTTVDLLNKFNDKFFNKNFNLAGRYEVMLNDLNIKEFKKGRMHWDADCSGPDIKVILGNSTSKIVTSKIFRNSYAQKGTFLAGNIELFENDNIRISVYDKDMVVTDVIGKITLSKEQIKEAVIRDKGIRLQFGQVDQLIIKMNKLN